MMKGSVEMTAYYVTPPSDSDTVAGENTDAQEPYPDTRICATGPVLNFHGNPLRKRLHGRCCNA